jgi:hypothetical protein
MLARGEPKSDEISNSSKSDHRPSSILDRFKMLDIFPSHESLVLLKAL